MPRKIAVTQLPRSFKLLDHTIKVREKSGLMDKHSAFGLWDAVNLTIYVDPDVPQSVLAHTLWHEIMHAVLDLTGHSKLSCNERFVDCVGGALAQVVRTLK